MQTVDWNNGRVGRWFQTNREPCGYAKPYSSHWRSPVTDPEADSIVAEGDTFNLNIMKLRQFTLSIGNCGLSSKIATESLRGACTSTCFPRP